MDLKNVYTFLKVQSFNSFSKAAYALNYAQSTVTAQIQQLENELGFPLFDRIGKQIFLTTQGQEFLFYAEQMMKISQQAQSIGASSSDVHGILRIGIFESLMFAYMPRIISKYKELYPHVLLQIQIGSGNLIDLLRRNQLDMIYISSGANESLDLLCPYHRKEEISFIAGANHPLAHAHSISCSDIFTYSCIATENYGYCYTTLKRIAAAHGKEIQRTIEIDNANAVSRLLPNGTEFAFLPEYSVTKGLENGTLVKLDVNEPQTYYYSQILYHKNKFVVPYMQSFIDIAKETYPGEED